MMVVVTSLGASFRIKVPSDIHRCAANMLANTSCHISNGKAFINAAH
jgi:hypothetical protein